jgi:hypothetical protein
MHYEKDTVRQRSVISRKIMETIENGMKSLNQVNVSMEVLSMKTILQSWV